MERVIYLPINNYLWSNDVPRITEQVERSPEIPPNQVEIPIQVSDECSVSNSVKVGGSPQAGHRRDVDAHEQCRRALPKPVRVTG